MHGFSHLIQSLSYSSGKFAAARELSRLSSLDFSAHGEYAILNNNFENE